MFKEKHKRFHKTFRLREMSCNIIKDVAEDRNISQRLALEILISQGFLILYPQTFQKEEKKT